MSIKRAIYTHLIGDHGLAFTASAGTDLITATGHSRVNGDKLRLETTGTLPGGLAAATDYFVRDLSGATFKLAATPGGAAIDITSAGSGTHNLTTPTGEYVDARVYWNEAPQDAAMPYIVLRLVSAERQPTVAGPSGLARVRVQADIVAATALSADNIRDALRRALDGYDKAMGAAALDVRIVHIESEADTLFPPDHGSDEGTHITSVDFFAWYAESVPAH